jgi:hypothetical protein
VLEAVRVVVPVPDFVMAPLPLILPETVVLLEPV